MISPNLIQEQLERKTEKQDKLREVQRYYSNAGKDRTYLNNRRRFDRSDFREVLVDQGGFCNGFIEAIYISGGQDVLLNIALKGKYKTQEVLTHVFNQLIEDEHLSFKNQFYTSIHIGDTVLEYILDSIGFRRVVDKPTLTRIQAPLDGYHLTYIFEKTRTVTNRAYIKDRKPLSFNRPLRTGNKQLEGNFDSLKRLKDLKEKK